MRRLTLLEDAHRRWRRESHLLRIAHRLSRVLIPRPVLRSRTHGDEEPLRSAREPHSSLFRKGLRLEVGHEDDRPRAIANGPLLGILARFTRSGSEPRSPLLSRNFESVDEQRTPETRRLSAIQFGSPRRDERQAFQFSERARARDLFLCATGERSEAEHSEASYETARSGFLRTGRQFGARHVVAMSC